jgi:hypothetical protein
MGLSDLRAGGHQVENLWTTGDGLGTTERTTVLDIWIFEEFIDFCGITVASWIFYVANERKINSLSGNILTKIIIFSVK